jgi:uncharacterized protein DUF3667
VNGNAGVPDRVVPIPDKERYFLEDSTEVSMTQTTSRASVCRNCGAAVASNYCPECGQETSLHPPSVREFAHELASHYVAVEGKLWRTLALLVLRPGRLTVEYLAGRRQKYIVPVRLYLTASFLFFAVAQFGNYVIQTTIERDSAADAHGVHAQISGQQPDVKIFRLDSGSLADLKKENFARCLKKDAACSLLERWQAPGLVKLQEDPQGFVDRFGERFRHSLPYAMFLVLPIFALLLKAAYRNRRMYYGEHLVFALHVHSFWFLVALVSVLTPESIEEWLALVSIAYGIWALHQVYGGRWIYTLLRGGTVTLLYLIVLGAGAAVLSVALLST